MVYRHGDVNLIPVGKVEGWLIARGSYILARGEATGSVHEISTEKQDDLEIYQNEDGVVYVRNISQAKVTHTSDHATITLEPGTYVQVPEREIDHFAEVERKVKD